MTGAIIAAIVTQYSHVFYIYAVFSFSGLAAFITAFFFDQTMDKKGDQISESQNGGQEKPQEEKRVSFKENFSALWRVIQIKEFFYILLYTLISGFMMPLFDGYDYFFYIDRLGMS